MQRITDFADAAIRNWLARFLLSGLISAGPQILIPDLFDAGIGRREVWLFLFWLVVLAGLAIYVSVRHLTSNWKIFSSITLGFAFVDFCWSLPYLLEYPTALKIYIRSFSSPFIFSSIASGSGIAIGYLVRRLIRRLDKR